MDSESNSDMGVHTNKCNSVLWLHNKLACMVLWLDKEGSGQFCLGARTGMQIPDLHWRLTWKWEHGFENTFTELHPYIVVDIYFCLEKQKGLQWNITFILFCCFICMNSTPFFLGLYLFLCDSMEMWSRSFVRAAVPGSGCSGNREEDTRSTRFFRVNH